MFGLSRRRDEEKNELKMILIKDIQDNKKGQVVVGGDRKKSLLGFIQLEMFSRYVCGYYQRQWCVQVLSLEKGLNCKGSLKLLQVFGRESFEEGCDGFR